jgi:pimeloyl-ACP methyl ester carboxylesterase
MTVVLVHGNPETSTLWEPLRVELQRDDIVALSPPGFGAPVPDGFGASADDYLAWLIGELETMGEPVDLVGHDWGGILVPALVCSRPDLIRSWCSDAAGVFAPDYIWHDFAQTWQTPGVGEEAIAGLIGMPATERALFYQSLGMTSDVANEIAAAANDAMGRCILALYRSAAQPALAQWGERLPAASARPGLVIIPTEDIYTGGETRARWAAERAGAEAVVLAGLGHWWMLEDPGRGAAVLTALWSKL